MKFSDPIFSGTLSGKIIPLITLVFSSAAGAVYAESPPSPQPPYRVLYSNDLTNIQGSPSAYRRSGTFRSESLEASVAETANTGIDVHMLQPGLGWVPYWPSKVLPMSEHEAYLQREGRKLNSYENYVLKGGDMVQVFVDESRRRGLAPFISLRVNDTHHVSRGMSTKGHEERLKAMAEFQLFADHPEWLLGEGAGREERTQYAFDFAVPEIRDYKLALIRELCENYDIDGLELDLMRHWRFFHEKNLPKAKRVEIMTDFLRRVRAILDETSRDGQRRMLGVRIPGYIETFAPMGLDLAQIGAAGVDIVNVSGHYFTDMQLEIGKIKAQLPDNVGVYTELQFVSSAIPPFDGNTKEYRRSTPRQLYTAAHQAYARGAAGVSTFNFQYYRGTRNPTDVPGPYNEPPFHVFERLRDPQWLATQPQHYVLGFLWNGPVKPNRPFSRPFSVAAPVTMQLDMAPPTGGWKSDGRLRIQERQSLGSSEWAVKINGVSLKPVEDISEPYPDPYGGARGEAEDYRAFAVPASALRDGMNDIEVTLTKGSQPMHLVYLDIAMP